MCVRCVSCVGGCEAPVQCAIGITHTVMVHVFGRGVVRACWCWWYVCVCVEALVTV